MTGALLWHLVHSGSLGRTEYILMTGAVAALAAAGAQGLLGGRIIAQRIAAGLLAITVVCMAAARYA